MGRKRCLAALLLVAGCGGSSFIAAPSDGGDAGDSTAPDSAAGVDAPVGDTARPGDAGSGEADATASDVGSPKPDAPTPTDAAIDAEACASTVYYLDGDGDHYGGTTTSTGCAPPSGGTWITVGGDCDDSNAMVNPGQTGYFASGYVPTGQSDVSFDYDCDGKETESGNSAKANCQEVSLSCVGDGYLPAVPARSGGGVDAFCGSDMAVACAVTNLVCKAQTPYVTSPITCH